MTDIWDNEGGAVVKHDWEERHIYEHNGHTVEIAPWYEQGGGIESIVAWCYTCDPEGKDLTVVDTREVSPRVALLTVRKYVYQHVLEKK